MAGRGRAGRRRGRPPGRRASSRARRVETSDDEGNERGVRLGNNGSPDRTGATLQDSAIECSQPPIPAPTPAPATAGEPLRLQGPPGDRYTQWPRCILIVLAIIAGCMIVHYAEKATGFYILTNYVGEGFLTNESQIRIVWVVLTTLGAWYVSDSLRVAVGFGILCILLPGFWHYVTNGGA